MKARSHDALRLDVAQFAADGAELSGSWPQADLTRLAELQSPPADAPLAEVRWQLRGERRAVTGGEPELWLHLQAHASVWLCCQRCLQPLAEPLALQRRLRFVQGQAEAEALDAELEDDVLALTRTLDARELVEDELLLALPLVPRHAQCPQPLLAPQPAPSDAAPTDAAAAQRPNPFAVLEALKKPRP